MNDAVLLNVVPEFYKGALTLCDNQWHFDNILVGYDRFYYIVEGECIIEINGIRHTAKANELYFLPNGSTQTLYTEAGKTVKKYWMHCRLKCGEVPFSSLIKLPFCVGVDSPQMVEQMFQNILSKSGEDTLSAKLEQNGEILKLLSYFLRMSEGSFLPVSLDNRISYIVSYIESNLSRNITVEELSKLLHFHPSYFIRFFKAQTGKTPIEFACDLRIKEAQKLLLREDVSIGEIALRTGFQTPHYFSRFFKKRTGMHPTEYRNTAINRHNAK